MECFICKENHNKCLKFLGKNICIGCMNSIANINVNNIFYRFYKEKIKEIYNYSGIKAFERK